MTEKGKTVIGNKTLSERFPNVLPAVGEQEMMKVLDVGCGATPKGDVNVDLFPNDIKQCGVSWNPKNVKNFVLADAENLPFKDKSFEVLLAFHVLEHLKNPLKALHEWKRVADVVTTKVPSPYHIESTPSHFFTWNTFTLENLLKQVFRNTEICSTDKINVFDGRMTGRIPMMKFVFDRFILKRFPIEIKAVCYG